MLHSFLKRLFQAQVAPVVRSLLANVGDIRDAGLIPGSRRSPGEGNGNPLKYSCLENPMDGGAWWATVHGVHKESDTAERLHLPVLRNSGQLSC